MELVVSLVLSAVFFTFLFRSWKRYSTSRVVEDPWKERMLIRINTVSCTGDGRCQDDCSEILTSVQLSTGRTVYVPLELARDFGATKVFDNVGPDGLTAPARVPDRLLPKIQTAQKFCAGECIFLERAKE